MPLDMFFILTLQLEHSSSPNIKAYFAPDYDANFSCLLKLTFSMENSAQTPFFLRCIVVDETIFSVESEYTSKYSVFLQILEVVFFLMENCQELY